MNDKKLKNKLVYKPFFDAEKLKEAGYHAERLEEMLMRQIRELATYHAESDLEKFWEAANPDHPDFHPDVRFLGPSEVTETMIEENVDKIMKSRK